MKKYESNKQKKEKNWNEIEITRNHKKSKIIESKICDEVNVL